MTRQIKANKDFYLQKIYFELLSFFINFKGDYAHNKNSVPLKIQLCYCLVLVCSGNRFECDFFI